MHMQKSKPALIREILTPLDMSRNGTDAPAIAKHPTISYQQPAHAARNIQELRLISHGKYKRLSAFRCQIVCTSPSALALNGSSHARAECSSIYSKWTSQGQIVTFCNVEDFKRSSHSTAGANTCFRQGEYHSLAKNRSQEKAPIGEPEP